jgi:sterol desaturase/sphingolipid hydroxylase (fatty acid hydroxylase superfamily)
MQDHDTHHSRFAVNYAFPFPFMDVLHGTYRGTWLGREFGRGLGPPLRDSDSGETAPAPH